MLTILMNAVLALGPVAQDPVAAPSDPSRNAPAATVSSPTSPAALQRRLASVDKRVTQLEAEVARLEDDLETVNRGEVSELLYIKEHYEGTERTNRLREVERRYTRERRMIENEKTLVVSDLESARKIRVELQADYDQLSADLGRRRISEATPGANDNRVEQRTDVRVRLYFEERANTLAPVVIEPAPATWLRPGALLAESN